MITSTTPDWVGQTYTLAQDLIVQTNADFVINNCTLKFQDGTGIVLQEGADLSVINNSKLTLLDLCDPFWKGISAQRVSNYPNLVNKNLVVISQSTIEFAQTALSLQTIDTSAPNASTNWAHINLTDALFSNNFRDLWIRGQSPGISAYPHILGQVNRSDFVLTNDFPVAYLPNSVKCQIQNLSKAIPFADCEFRNEVPAFLVPFELIAMQYRHAPIQVHDYSPNNTGMGSSESVITGFTRGIHGTGMGNVTIQGTDFANWRSGYLWMRGKHTIEDNDFYCLPAGIFNGLQGALFIQTALSPITQESLDVANAPYGLYMDGPDGVFNVIDNHFETTIPGYGNLFSHGMIANNTGDKPNRVRRNVFTYMQRALKIQGDNRNDDYQDGLKYSCNFFDYNDSDIREVNSSTGNVNGFGVPHQFSLLPGSVLGDPANNYTQSSPSCGHCEFDDLSNTMTSSLANHRYYRLDTSAEPDNAETSPPPKVIIVPVTDAFDECESSIQLLSGGSTSEYLNGALQDYSQMLDNLHFSFQQLVDGGNTNDLIQIIQSAQYNEALELYYNLMQKSPNLSEEVLLESLSKLDLPNILLAQILGSNPHAAKSGRIVQAVDTRPISFDEYQKSLIDQGLNQFSSLETLEGLIAGVSSQRSECIQLLFEQIDLSDSITDKLQSKLDLLDPEKYAQDFLFQVLVYFEHGQFDQSGSMASSAESVHKLSAEELMDYISWPTLMEIYEMRDLAPVGFTLSQGQREFLFNSLNATSSLVGSRSLQMLIDMDELEYAEPIIEQVEEQRTLVYSIDESKREPLVFPNPTQDRAQVSWNQPASRLEVLNSVGQILVAFELNELQSQALVDLGSFPAGIYSIRLQKDDRIVGEVLIVKR